MDSIKLQVDEHKDIKRMLAAVRKACKQLIEAQNTCGSFNVPQVFLLFYELIIKN